MHISNQKRFAPARGFTIAEVVVATGVFAAIGTVLVAIAHANSVLLAKNFGINMSHNSARVGSEKLLALVQAAVAAPVLVDANLNPVAGNGPAAGITFLRIATDATYSTVGNINATDTTMKIRRTAGMPAPQAGDVLVFLGTDSATYTSPWVLGMQATITTAAAQNATDTNVTFSSTIGALCSPTVDSGTVFPGNTKMLLLNKLACVATGTELRLLRNAAVPGSYDVLAQLVPTAGQTTLLPFRYTAADRRWVDIDMRVQSTTYNKRLNTVTNFFDLKESVAYRSAIFIKNS